jgi:mono/diheme cytochrome c family protein
MPTNCAPEDLAKPHKAGGALLAAVFWTLTLGLFLLPFLRPRDGLGSEQGDFSRAEDDVPFPEDVANFEADFELPLGALIESASENAFGRSKEALAAAGVIDPARLPEGQRAYELHCIGCHGSLGDGGGAAARFLSPRPRNFREGLFKFKSTPSGKRPRPEDLLRTLSRGLAGSSMPDFQLLPEATRLDLVEYVRYLALRGEFEGLVLDAAWEEEELPDAEAIAELSDLVNARWGDAALSAVYPKAPEVARDANSVERGRELFNSATGASCFTCHGARGRGDGPTAGDYVDDWGYPLRPRDLSLGVFRAGAEGLDLYRTIAVGIDGTPMGSFEGGLSGEEIWHLVHFVQSLPRSAE